MALPLAATISQPASADSNGLHYVECAFNFTDGSDVAILFTANNCFQFNYAAPNDFVLKGPMTIDNFFPSLRNKSFAQGIDSAFTSSTKNEVYLFKDDFCVLLNFVSGDIIEDSIKPITDAFKCLTGSVFKDGIDAAFASHKSNEAYIFKGDQYALINFTDDRLVRAPQDIILGFPFLSSTDFARGLDAAFKSSTKNEAYIFKGNAYAIINYVPGATANSLIDQVSPITEGFKSLKNIIPWRTSGC